MFRRRRQPCLDHLSKQKSILIRGLAPGTAHVVTFRSAKGRSFAERKTTIAELARESDRLAGCPRSLIESDSRSGLRLLASPT